MIEVVATRWICDQSPEGAVLTLPDQDALVLIEMGMVRRTAEASVPRTTGEPPAPAPAEPPPPPQAEPADQPAPAARRSYRRRDMAAEGETTSKGEPQAGE